ncbi:MAG: hypothetical protein IJU23_00345 [Proteobacteria bacterium]|nr:hypothetical protein [Pseudomonadota bacterium]
MKKRYLLAMFCSLALFGCTDDSNESKPECSKNAECDSGKCLDSGKCATTAAKGETCNDEVVCQQDLECIDGVCNEKTECTKDGDCDSGKCLDGGKCAQAVGKGKKCNDEVVCKKGLACIGGVCKESSACTKDGDCDSGKCLSSGQCAQAVDKDEACNEDVVCKKGLACEGGVCVATVIDSCSTDDDCLYDANGHTTCLPSQKCGAYHPKGEACDDERDLCESQLECHDDVCIKRVNEGDTCSEDDWIFCPPELICLDDVCQEEEPEDPGPSPEPEPQTDDSDVLEGIVLPQPKPLSDDPCLKCTNTQECLNGTCLNSTRHNVSVKKAFTDEAGNVAQIAISLTKNPTSDVTFKCWIESTSPYPEAEMDCSAKIEAGDWIVGQFSSATSTKYLTVKGLPDNVDDGDQKYYVMLETISADSYFSNIVHSPMEYTNRNIDKAGVSWHADQALLTSENGQSASFTMSLDTKPLAPVKLKMHSSDQTEGTVDPKVLVFTPDNWNTPQTVTVTGVDDEYKDGAMNYSVLTTTVSVDPKYNNIEVPEIKLSNIDNNKVGVTLSIDKYKLSPADPSLKATVILSTKPTADVKITLVNTSALLKAENKSLVFTPDNWDVPQAFDLSVPDFDAAFDAITMVCISGSASSDDSSYLGEVSNLKCVDIYRYNPLNFDYTGKEQKVTLLPGEYILQVWGSQGGGVLNSLGGYGGYSHGKVKFEEKTDVYINVGGIGPFNGGGKAAADGGGATHIATESGELATLSEKRDSVLLVAGGGGGSERNPGGYGGGSEGGKGNTYAHVTVIPTGGTQTAGGAHGETDWFGVGTDGSFGQGGEGIGQIDYEHNPTPHLDSGGGGGGGWYGGGGVPYAGGGGGGSGHVGDKIVDGETLAGSGEFSFESPTGGFEAGHAGTGYARISIIERDPPTIN